MKQATKLLLLSLSILFLSIQAVGQNKDIIIKFTPDDFPMDISWELQHQDFKGVVASGDLSGCLPNEECIVFEGSLEDRCYTLVIKDQNFDGIAEPGGYEVFYDGRLVVEGREFGSDIYHNFNCGLGETCETAEVLNLPTPPFTSIYTPDWKEYWFELTPEIDGYYKISTCDNFLSGKGWADTTIWVYDDCNRKIQTEGTEGALAHNEDSHQCAPSSEFDFFPLSGGTTYYIRVKPITEWENSNDSLFFKVQKRPVKRGCNDPAACNYDPLVQILTAGSCDYSDDCGPDLRLDEEYLRNSIEVDTVYNNDACFVTEGCLRGPGAREVIRFSTKIDNVGDADYVVGLPQNDTILFSRENCHGHYHHQGYAEYLIYSGQGQPQPVGFKSGFCVMDLDCTDRGTLGKYYCGYMGITEGCSDIYEAYLDCQWIDITNIPDGKYSIVIRVNHFRLEDARSMQEKTYSNNSGTACVVIDRSSGVLVVTVEDDCEPYVDCLGVTGGDAEIDCNGECGGSAHFGDLDGSGELELSDYEIYRTMLANKVPLETPCDDVNGDGILTIYDAALVYDCLEEKIEQADNPFHEHCTFPAGLDTPSEQVSVRVKEFNMAEKYIDLELWAPTRDLSAFQINTSGFIISNVEKLYTAKAEFMEYNDESIFAFHPEEFLPRNAGFEAFLRISYSATTGDSLCIKTTSEFINRDYNRVGAIFENNCQNVSAVNDIKENAVISLIPNPAVNKLTVTANGLSVRSMQVLNLDGKTLMAEHIGGSSNFDLKVSDLPEGLYLMQLTFNDGEIATERFMIAK